MTAAENSRSLKAPRGAKRIRTRLFCAIYLASSTLTLASVAGCGGADSEERAPDSDDASSRQTVVLYTSVDQEYARQVIARFEQAHPEINVTTRFDTEATKTTGLVERVRAERSDPRADVFWSSEVFLTIKLADEGLLRSWDGAGDLLSDWPSAFRDAESRWYGFSARARVIAYMPDRVAQPPTALADLVDPRFKGRIVMADPNYGTTRGHIAALFALWGTEKAEQFLHDLVANDVRIVTSNSQAVRELLAGAADLALTDTDDVWAVRRNGYNVRLAYPVHLHKASGNEASETSGEEVGRGTLLIPNTVGLIAGRPANSAAEEFARFLLSAEVQRLLYESDSHNIPVGPNALTIAPEHVVPDPLRIAYNDVAGRMEEAIAAANRILLQR